MSASQKFETAFVTEHLLIQTLSVKISSLHRGHTRTHTRTRRVDLLLPCVDLCCCCMHERGCKVK